MTNDIAVKQTKALQLILDAVQRKHEAEARIQAEAAAAAAAAPSNFPASSSSAAAATVSAPSHSVPLSHAPSMAESKSILQ